MRRSSHQTRDEVLGHLREAHGPLTAYDVLARMQAPDRKVAPPTVYRALAALTAAGSVHRIEATNAYVACCHGGADGDHEAILSICDDCGSVEEHADPAVLKDLARLAARNRFTPERQIIELHGRCGDCAAPDEDAA